MTIIEQTKDNLSDWKGSFLLKETVKKDLQSNPFGIYLLALEEKEVVGYLYYSRIYERVEINQIEVRLDKRSQGIASTLLNTLIQKEQKDITLEVKENNIPALALYQKFGFERKAIRKGYYQGIDGILMERKER